MDAKSKRTSKTEKKTHFQEWRKYILFHWPRQTNNLLIISFCMSITSQMTLKAKWNWLFHSRPNRLIFFDSPDSTVFQFFDIPFFFSTPQKTLLFHITMLRWKRIFTCRFNVTLVSMSRLWNLITNQRHYLHFRSWEGRGKFRQILHSVVRETVKGPEILWTIHFNLTERWRTFHLNLLGPGKHVWLVSQGYE